MKCNCIAVINKNLQEKLGYEDAQLDTAFVFVEKETIQVIDITAHYHKRKSDGSLIKNPRTVSIIPKFCPFCGIPVKVDDEVTDEVNKE